LPNVRKNRTKQKLWEGKGKQTADEGDTPKSEQNHQWGTLPPSKNQGLFLVWGFGEGGRRGWGLGGLLLVGGHDIKKVGTWGVAKTGTRAGGG